MDDIVPELLEAVKKSFEAKTKGLGESIAKGVKNYEEAYRYAIKVGGALSRAFKINITSEVLPDGMMYFNIANRVVLPMLQEGYELSSAAAIQAQRSANKAAGIGIKPQIAKFDEDRAKGIIDRLSSEPFDDVKWILDDPVKTFSKNVVDETLEKNVEFQGKSGLHPKIVRTASANACPWCLEMEGEYEYPDVPKDVYRRHENCDCIVEYIDGGKRQDIWSKKTYSRSQEESVTENQRRTTLTMPKSDIIGAAARFKTGEMSTDEYVMAKHLLSLYKEECKIPYYRGREGLVEEFDNNLTDEEKGMSLIRKPVDSYWYTAIHWGHGQYRFIRAEAIENDEAELRALFGDEYDDIFR